MYHDWRQSFRRLHFLRLVLCMRQVLGPGALGRPRGIGWRGRWEGGSGWGIHVNPWLIHVNVWQKPLQYCKVISLQPIKINEKKKKDVLLKNKHYDSLSFLQEYSHDFSSPYMWNNKKCLWNTFLVMQWIYLYFILPLDKC